MEKEEIKLLRDNCEIARGMKDEEIDKLDAYLKETPYLRRPNFIRIENLIELKRLRRLHYPAQPEPFDPRNPMDVFWLFCCESLFVDGHYGPCCVWARATIENRLYELCLLDKKSRAEFIVEKDRLKGKNPGIEWCLSKLGYPKDGEVYGLCMEIKNNGNYVVHHRLELLMSGQSIEEGCRKLGFSEKAIGVVLQDEDLFKKANRYNWERDKAIESMSKLYEFESKRPPISWVVPL
jgi:hypothetical protein